MTEIETRTYNEREAAGFMRTREAFGELSNMAGGMPLRVGAVVVPSTEHWYQLHRYPHRPDIQAQILAVASPMMCKRKAYEFIDQTREDFHSINIALMKHALRLKLMCHPERIRAVYGMTADRPIVEISRKDAFWGAVPDGYGRLVGKNVLGRLHMGERERIKQDPDWCRFGVDDPHIPQFMFLGNPVGDILPSSEPSPGLL